MALSCRAFYKAKLSLLVKIEGGTLPQKIMCGNNIVSNKTKCSNLSTQTQVKKSFNTFYLKNAMFQFSLKSCESLSKQARLLQTISSSQTWLTSTEIEGVLMERNIKYRKGFTGYITKSSECCEESCNLFIDMHTGHTTCYECGKEQTWKAFKSSSLSTKKAQTVLPSCSVKIDEDLPKYTLGITSKELSVGDIKHFKLNSLKLSTFQYFNVKFINSKDNSCLFFPYYDISKNNIICCKKIFAADENSELIMSNPKIMSLFGWHLIDPLQEEVVLTASELDSLAIFQATGLPSLSLPLSSLPPSILPFLEQFKRIVFWFPNDYKSKETAFSFAKKLSLERCWIVLKAADCPLDYLNRHCGNGVARMIQTSAHMAVDKLLTLKDLGDDLFNELIHSKENAGVTFKRFPLLNEYLRGHRRGELTIFTGPTGSGKTTFLSELSLDLCMQGVKTLWGSFEIKNVRLANIMLHQYSGVVLENQMHDYYTWFSKFESLPMYFMSYFGSQNLDSVIQTIEHAVYMFDIEHVVIDNLQFMMSYGEGEDRFLSLDKAISSFRKCATEFNIHVTLVVHPRKESDDSVLQTASIYGSAKASQEADNILILQNYDSTAIQVKKNRFNGTVGTVPLCFNPESLCMSGFYRHKDTNEETLPKLAPIRPIRKLTAMRKNKRK